MWYWESVGKQVKFIELQNGNKKRLPPKTVVEINNTTEKSFTFPLVTGNSLPLEPRRTSAAYLFTRV